MNRRKRRQRRVRTFFTLVVLGIAIYFAWPYIPFHKLTEPAPAPASDSLTINDNESDPHEMDTDVKPVRPEASPAKTTITVVPPPPIAPVDIALGDAIKKYQAGLTAEASDPIKARKLLSEAYFSGKLNAESQDNARRRLETLAKVTLLGREASFQPKRDPYVLVHTFKSGDTLEALERKLRLHVPTELLLKINGLHSGTQCQEGKTYKLIKGPFHAIVYKSKFVMDIYLHRQEPGDPVKYERIFIKRLAVGLGVDGSTPAGRWRLGCGTRNAPDGRRERAKLKHAIWNPPAGSEVTKQIEYGDPGYPLGEKGLWIGLVGTDENTSLLQGYGIHSTNDPASIGKNASLGCIRLADNDAEQAYRLLYELWSTVEIRP